MNLSKKDLTVWFSRDSTANTCSPFSIPGNTPQSPEGWVHHIVQGYFTLGGGQYIDVDRASFPEPSSMILFRVIHE